MEQKPTVGRIVHYKVSTADIGTALTGNGVASGDVLPAIITRVFPSEANLSSMQIFTDSGKRVWKGSVSQGDDEGQWNWPAKV